MINGPVASAGSIPNLSRISGIDVPINEAIIITEIKAIVTGIPVSYTHLDVYKRQTITCANF